MSPGPYALYALGARTRLGRTVRTAHRGTSGALVGGLSLRLRIRGNPNPNPNPNPPLPLTLTRFYWAPAIGIFLSLYCSLRQMATVYLA